jgi:undecaprenyl-phosphate 4-deoxy-4-formamido-L-arabinose transferase
MALKMNHKPDVSVIVPVYNGEQTLPELVQRLQAVLLEYCRRFEVLLINDGSSDGSWITICQLVQEHVWVQGIDLARNYGQHNALLCGIRAGKFDFLVTMDDDLQNPPEEIPKLLQKLGEGYDVVYGVPEKDEHGLLRNIASQFTKIALRDAMGTEIARNVSAFRAFRKQVCVAFPHFRGSFVSMDVLLTWGTTRFAALRVKHAPRRAGISGYSMGKLISHAFNMITGFSVLPLQVASVLGFAFTLLGFVILLYVLGRYFLRGSPVPGFPFLASIIAIFSGAQLFALGVIGEYLARMHFRTMERPTYAVRDTTPPTSWPFDALWSDFHHTK